ncbi:MAG TPA: monovalent cation:proton antiporter-2 (CPA2) family protein [Solimonas sp.]|nr:monovalent cation:proton antiporter-2 (CPA2) family protein [Solimonas sp.]
MLIDIALFLACAVLFVPLYRRLGLGAVLGYLSAGILIGPSALGLVEDVGQVLHFSEFGVVLLLFVIGLELQPSRLWTLRRAVFGLGGAQVGLTMALLGLAGWLLGLPPVAALVAGFGLAMSSTAFVLQMLAERKELSARHGRAAFAILLFQDLSVIPFLALIPLLAAQGATGGGQGWIEAARVVGMFALVIFAGRYALRPLFRAIAASDTPEVFTAAALLVVLATALGMQAVGLSMSLGAFTAGVLLADSEYRHELQADIEPFKGLLLGLFFIAVGMSADIGLLLAQPALVLGLTAGLLAAKALVLFALGRLHGLTAEQARSLAFALPQGGEFAFVLFGVAVTAGVMDAGLQSLLIVVVTLSMIATPLLYMLQARWRRESAARPYDEIGPQEHDVILAGFGPFGQVVGRILRVKRIPFTVLDKDSEQVDFVRRFGSKIFYGDAGRLDLLRAAEAHKARLFVLVIPDIEASLHVAETVRRHFPHLQIFAMAINRNHALRLMDLGISHVIRRSYFSSLEMTRLLLQALGDTPEAARHAVDTFQRHDEVTLRRQQALFRDEQQLIQSARDAAQELEQLFEADTPPDGR